MKIAIDAATLLMPSAGVKNYLHYWLEALQSVRSPEDRILLYPPFVRMPGSSVEHQKAGSGPIATRLGLYSMHFLNIRGNPALDFVLGDSDVFHCSQHTARRPRRVRATATIFDLSCWTVPETHTPANIEATKRYAEKILKTCDGLIAISASARDDAADILRIPPERIEVIHPGVAESFFHVSAERALEVRRKYELEKDFLLFVGCIEPRKNVPGILQAYAALPQNVRADFQLVLAGPFGWADDSVRRKLEAGDPNFRYLGYVPEPDLPGLVKGATALVYPSFYEGFGLPAVQAMAAGVPVIASNTSSLPEVVGDAGLLVDPANVEQLSDAMNRMLSSQPFREGLTAKGRKRAEEFRWTASAERSLEFFHRVGRAGR